MNPVTVLHTRNTEIMKNANLFNSDNLFLKNIIMSYYIIGNALLQGPDKIEPSLP